MGNASFSWFYPAAGACGETGFGTRYIGEKEDLEIILRTFLTYLPIDKDKSMVIDLPTTFHKFFLAGDGLVKNNDVSIRGDTILVLQYFKRL